LEKSGCAWKKVVLGWEKMDITCAHGEEELLHVLVVGERQGVSSGHPHVVERGQRHVAEHQVVDPLCHFLHLLIQIGCLKHGGGLELGEYRLEFGNVSPPLRKVQDSLVAAVVILDGDHGFGLIQ
jgi:hypothetical protein